MYFNLCYYLSILIKKKKPLPVSPDLKFESWKSYMHIDISTSSVLNCKTSSKNFLFEMGFQN